MRRDFGNSCISPSAPYSFHLFLLAFALCPCHWHFLHGKCLHSRAAFKLDDLFLFIFTFSSIMCPLTSYSFTLLCCFMDEWISPIIFTLFWFLMDELSQLTLTLICFFLDEWTKPTTLTSLCFFMDEWIKPMRLTLLLIFHGWIKPLAFTLFLFFHGWKTNDGPPWLKQKLTWTIIEHMIMRWFHALCRYYRKCHSQLDSPRAEKGHKLREWTN